MPHFCDAFVCCPCLYDEDIRMGREINKKINQEMKKSKEYAQTEIKMLLLGTGEAGKSTIIKQMRIIHGKEFEDEKRRLAFVQAVRENVIESIQILVRNMEKLNVPLANSRNKANVDRVIEEAKKPYDASVIPSLFQYIEALWNDDGVQECFRRRAEFQFVYLSDSTKYFLDRVTTIADKRYVPTEQDILRVRKSSTGVQEYSFLIKNTAFRVVDVGGQRSERRKWIHCFENVTALIFVASLSDYDQSLLDKTARHQDEDKVVNRLEESLALFSVVMQDRFLMTASTILFLNKTDVFDEKIQERDLADYVPEYSGPQNDPKTARKFILQKFLEISKKHGEKSSKAGKLMNTEAGKMIYPHFTCATDTENMKFVTKAVEDLLLRTALVDFNLV